MTTSQSNEHLRVASGGAYKNVKSNNFDPTRRDLDFEVVDGKVVPLNTHIGIQKRINDNLKRRKIRNPNSGRNPQNRRIIADFILGGSRETMQRLAFGDQEVNYERGANNSNIVRKKGIEDWAIDTYNFMCKRFGKDNIAAFVVHLDELNPHVHCTVIPVDEKNRISWKKVMVGNEDTKEAYRRTMLDLHNEFAKVNEKYGLDRGDDITITKAKHRTTEQYHEERRIALIETNQKIEKENRSLEEEVRHARIRLKSLNTMVRNAEAKVEDLTRKLEELQKNIIEGTISKEDGDRLRKNLEQELEEAKAKYLDKLRKLEIAEAQLKDVLKRTENAQEEFGKIQGKIDVARKEVERLTIENKKNQSEIAKSMSWSIVGSELINRFSDFLDYRETLPYNEREIVDKASAHLFGDTLLSELVNEGTETLSTVAEIASNLFMGYLDTATDLSHSLGGASAPSSGWGRDKDEDDDAFKRRSMMMALNMIHRGRSRRRR